MSKPRVKVRILKKKKSTLNAHIGRASGDRATKSASTTSCAEKVRRSRYLNESEKYLRARCSANDVKIKNAEDLRGTPVHEQLAHLDHEK